MAQVYLDTETYPIEAGMLAPPLVCVQLAVDLGPVEIILAGDPRLAARLRQHLLADQIAGHNIAYDLAVIAQEFPDLMPLIWQAYDEDRIGDTMLAAQLYDIAEGGLQRKYSLQGLAERIGYTLTKGSESWQLRYGELDGVPVEQWPTEAVRYAEDDIVATRLVWTYYGGSSDRVPTLGVQVRAAWALHLASCHGMVCDPAAVQALEQHIDDVQRRLLPVLQAAGFIRANGTRNDAAVRDHAERVGVSKRTKAGKVSVNAEALRDCDDPDLKALVEYQNADKLRSTYLPVVRAGTVQPVQCRYGLVESGRTSCSSPNLQNLPRSSAVRECFVARPGHVYVAADYSVIELVCLAEVLVAWFGFENCRMAQALCDGQDLHVVTAANILGQSYATTLHQIKAGDKQAKDARQLAKGLNFGIPGGLGPDKLQSLLRGYGHNVTRMQAVALKTQWLNLYPEMHQYFARISAYTRTPWCCKHPITGFVRGGLEYCNGANHLFQHLAAFGAKNALYAVQRACFCDENSPLYGARLVAFVHDELLVEVPEDRLDPAARELQATMVAEFEPSTPHVPVKAEALAMRRWCKEAKPLYNSAGMLQVWTP